MCRTCYTAHICVPGWFPWVFLGQSGRGAASLRARLAGLGRVGTEAYTALREAAEDGEIELPLNLTLRLPEGGVVSLGPGLLLPTNQLALRGLEVARGLLTCIS